MIDENHLFVKSGFAPYDDGSGFRVTITIEQREEGTEPTISLEQVYQLPVSDWVVVARKIERLIDIARASPLPPSMRGGPENAQ